MIFNHISDCTILFATPDMYVVVGEVIMNRMSQCLQKNIFDFFGFWGHKGDVPPSPLQGEGGTWGQSHGYAPRGVPPGYVAGM